MAGSFFRESSYVCVLLIVDLDVDLICVCCAELCVCACSFVQHIINFWTSTYGFAYTPRGVAKDVVRCCWWFFFLITRWKVRHESVADVWFATRICEAFVEDDMPSSVAV